MQPFTVEITHDPLPEKPQERNPAFGANIRFQGVVRELEKGAKIQGIKYSCYEEMAEKTLAQLCERGLEQFGEHSVRIIHRAGFVPAGETSVEIDVSAPHSAEAFEYCQWYLKALKNDVPIWKGIDIRP